MELERLETLNESEKSKIYLVFDTENRRMLVEKHLQGKLPIYERLMELPHPYLPKLYDVRYVSEEEEEKTIVVEEYIEGRSIAESHPAEKQLRVWLLELCQVLQYLHKNQIVHRDIKPSNLLIGADGHIRLIDFDAAREEKPQAERDTRLIATKGTHRRNNTGLRKQTSGPTSTPWGSRFGNCWAVQPKKPAGGIF